jgi:hypothetical protein
MMRRVNTNAIAFFPGLHEDFLGEVFCEVDISKFIIKEISNSVVVLIKNFLEFIYPHYTEFNKVRRIQRWTVFLQTLNCDEIRFPTMK